VAQLWEETPDGAVERVRLVGKPGFAAATEEEARACAVDLLRHWLGGGSDREHPRATERRRADSDAGACADCAAA
jgi:hypothetical protein